MTMMRMGRSVVQLCRLVAKSGKRCVTVQQSPCRVALREQSVGSQSPLLFFQSRWVSGNPSTSRGTLVEGEIVEKTSLETPNDDDTYVIEQELKQALQNHQSLVDSADHDRIVESLHGIRDLYEQLNWWDDALQTESTCLDYVQDDEEASADCFGRMGRYYLEMNKLRQAQRCFQTCLDLLTKIHPDQFHHDLGRAYNDLARVELEQGNLSLEESMPFLEQAENHYRYHGKTASEFDILDEEIDENAPKQEERKPHEGELPKILKNQALLYRVNDRHDLAKGKYEEALELVLEEEQRVEIRVSIADCLLSLEEIDDALERYQDLLSSMKGKDETPLEGVLRHNVGIICSKQGRNDDALMEFQKAYDIKRRTFGESHIEVATTLNGLGAVHATKNNMGEALSYFREALLIARVNAQDDLGDNDPQVQHALRNIALVQGDMPAGGHKPDPLAY